MNRTEHEDHDFADDRYGSEHGPDGNWLPAECVVCSETTQTRCAACRRYVCSHHDACPNGCDDPSKLLDGSAARPERLGALPITCAECGATFLVEYRFSNGFADLAQYRVECPKAGCGHPHHPTLAGEVVDVLVSENSGAARRD